jgi:outer membrane protein assembly factor BamB
MQKAGVFHVVETKTMDAAWTRTLGVPSAFGNAGTGAWDGDSLYVAANGGNEYSFDIGGIPVWATYQVADAARYQPVTVANGVVYTVTNAGVLLGLDSGTGVPVLARPISNDVDGEQCVTLATGVAVARNTVYTQCEGGWVVAYRP